MNPGPNLVKIDVETSGPHCTHIQVHWPQAPGWLPTDGPHMIDWYLFYRPGASQRWGVSDAWGLLDGLEPFTTRGEALAYIVIKTQATIGAQSPLVALAADYSAIVTAPEHRRHERRSA